MSAENKFYDIHSGALTQLAISDQPGVSKTEVDSAYLSMDGFVGDRHGGRFVASDSRGVETRQYPKGTPLLNLRQVTAGTQEEFDAIAQIMRVEFIDPIRHAGVNLVLSFDEPELNAEFTDRSTRVAGIKLRFPEQNSLAPKASLLVTGVINPCRFPGDEIVKTYPEAGLKPGHFTHMARGHRGVGFMPEHIKSINNQGNGEVNIKKNEPVELWVPKKLRYAS